MTVSNFRHILNVIKNKSGKIKKYQKHNVPKERSCGAATNRCQFCLRVGGHVGKYGINLCRHCFRDYAQKLGFKKYS
jgi:ribosomal protein S14